MKPRILWASAFCPHDTSSGAAIEIKFLLENLVARGMDVRAVACFLFDHPDGAGAFPKLDEELAANADKQFFEIESGGIKFSYMRTKSRVMSDLTDWEQRQFFAYYCSLLNEYKPDLVQMYGGGMLEMALRAEARRRGIPVVYSLCNPNHGAYSFPDVDLIITASAATAKLYATRDRIHVLPTGPFINPARVLAPKREPKYITFVNPCVEKGVSLMARLAQMALTRLPEARFLVVQSRGNWQSILPHLKPGNEPFDPTTLSNVDVAEHTPHIQQVYALTKVLLVPSLWFEAFGMVATEANLNGIPVLASSSGGLPEAVGEGGVVLDAPAGCKADYLQMPTSEEMTPWLDALTDMLREDKQQEWEAKAKAAAELHAPARSTERLLDLYAPLLARRASQNPQIYRSGSFTM